jgi:hypothetical protein
MMRHYSFLSRTLVVLPILLIAGVLGCRSSTDGANPAGGDDTGLSPFDCTADPFSEPFMRGAIETLAQEEWEGRKFDSEGLRLAAQWIAVQFACVGLTPGASALPGAPNGTFEQTFETDGDEIEPASDISDYTYDPGATYSFTNIVGSIPGGGTLAREVIVVGAHMDHFGRYGKERNAMVLGADDDASGILALLAMAKQLLDEGLSADRRTIVFAAWGIEEDPFYIRGSQAFIEALDATAKDRIMYYVNFDMVGAYDHYETVYAMGTHDAVDGYGASPGNTLMASIADSYPELNTDLGERGSSSDHVTFCANGIPYVFFWTEDDCYHRSCDTGENIDYEHMAAIIRMATHLTMALATKPDLATAREEFPNAYEAAYPGEDCWTQD